VGLVDIVVWVLADDDDLDIVEWRVAGPGEAILSDRESPVDPNRQTTGGNNKTYHE